LDEDNEAAPPLNIGARLLKLMRNGIMQSVPWRSSHRKEFLSCSRMSTSNQKRCLKVDPV